MPVAWPPRHAASNPAIQRPNPDFRRATAPLVSDPAPILAVDTLRSYTPTSFTWDPAKRKENLRKHRIDFADAVSIFQGLTFTAEDDREAYGEQRFLTLGMLGDQVVSVTHTERGGTIRIISIRKATKHEARFYFSQVTY